jgi:hypothetical protein
MINITLVPSLGMGSKPACLRRVFASALLVGMALISLCSAQSPFATGHSDNQRTGADVNETLLTPQNVNKNQFGFLFNYPIDYMALAQPLYVPNVSININGQVTQHNVVYVATMADSVYAFDADNNTGTPLWWVNFTNPANGITTASGGYLPCSGTGFAQEGIIGTPAIDTTTGTMYLVAKTVENGTVRHHLHALDITNGSEKFGGPTLISATSTSLKGHVTNFNSMHQKNRPGLLFSNGVVYMAFGSNGCNDGNSGWVLAYDGTSLQQTGVFNTSPDSGLTSIWQTGGGLAADENGHVYAVTAESNFYDVPFGGQSYCHTVLEFAPDSTLPNSLVLSDYFTPAVVAYLNAHDLDLSSGGPLILPDQDGQFPHFMVAGGKQGTIYFLNRDQMGTYSLNDANLQETGGQELTFAVGHVFNSPAYWNGVLYYAGNSDLIKGFSVSGGVISPNPVVTSARKYGGSHSPSISANGNTDGVLWVMGSGILYAFNATSLQALYNTSLIKTRDGLPAIAHFVTQTVANGKVYVATQTTLQVYGLFQNLTTIGGDDQSAQVLTTLPAPIQLQVTDPYSGVGIPGVTVTFSDGGKKGDFDPPSAVSDASGNVSTFYTFAKTAGIVTITASSAKAASMTFTETATPGPATKIITYSGNKQSGQAGSILPAQLRIKIQDAYANGVPGITATFSDPSGGGTFNPTSSLSNASGLAQVGYQVPNTAGTYKLVVNAPGLKAGQLTEYATGVSPANLIVVSGNNQTAPVNTALSQSLVVQVTDIGGNPIPGVSVVFSAASGVFAGTPATSDTNGLVTISYTTGPNPGTVVIVAAVNGLNTQMNVTVTSQ